MELTELTEKFKSVLNIEKICDAPQKIMQTITSGANDTLREWINYFPDLSEDQLQPIFQYYMADRKEKMQDYTSKSLAKACVVTAGISNAKICYDMCAGSGALTIQAWNINKDCYFICEEYDERVIPFLIFNLALRNTNATVIHGNVLSGERFKAWKLTSSKHFSMIMEISPPKTVSVDVCISNPPYNMKWQHEPFMQLDDRFNLYGLPPESNANYAFILSALVSAKRAVLILPNSVLENGVESEREIRKEIVENNKIDSIILNPDNMFESTAISTCLFCVDNNKSDTFVEFIDMSNTYIEETRKQKGQIGSKCHTNRIYEKTVKVFSDENVDTMLQAVKNRTDTAEFAKSSSIQDIKSFEFSLNPRKYIEFVYREPKHREYKEILADINKIAIEKNKCKLIINETLAKRLGFDISLYKNENLSDDPLEKLIQKITGNKLIKHDYIQFTKNKNEFVFKNNCADSVSTILISILQMWKQHIMYLNEEENKYLLEMRDALLPDLMSGKIEP